MTRLKLRSFLVMLASMVVIAPLTLRYFRGCLSLMRGGAFGTAVSGVQAAIAAAQEANEILPEFTLASGDPLPASGPMVFDSWEKGVQMNLVRNETYHGSVSPDVTRQGELASVDGVQINFVTDFNELRDCSAGIARLIANKLSELDPAGAGLYQHNAAALVSELQQWQQQAGEYEPQPERHRVLATPDQLQCLEMLRCAGRQADQVAVAVQGHAFALFIRFGHQLKISVPDR